MGKSGDATEDTAVLEEFKRQIEVVQSMEDYDDDALQAVVPAALAVTTSAGGVELETAAPATAPGTGTGDDTGNGIGPGVIAGAVFGAIACAGALVFAVQWQRQRRLASALKTVLSTGGTSTAKDPEIHMHEVFPNAVAPPVAPAIAPGTDVPMAMPVSVGEAQPPERQNAKQPAPARTHSLGQRAREIYAATATPPADKQEAQL